MKLGFAPVFACGAAPGSMSWSSFGASLAIHCVLVMVLPPLISWGKPVRETVRARLMPKEISDMVLLLPPSLVIRRDPPKPEAAARSRLKVQQPGQPRSQILIAEAKPAQREDFLLRPPTIKAETKLPADTPSVAVWTGHVPMQRPARAGSAMPLPRKALPVARPTLEPPLPASLAGDMSIPKPLPGSVKGPLLPPVSSTPVSIAATAAPVEQGPPPGSELEGRPVAVAAITPRPPAADQQFRLPESVSAFRPVPVSVTAANQEAAPDTANDPPPRSEDSKSPSPGSAPPKPGRNTAGAGQEVAGQSAAGQPGQSGRAGNASRTASAAGTPAVVKDLWLPAKTGPIHLVEFSDGSRQITYPEGGSFDLVVLDTANTGNHPKTEDLLSGRPIHTTFIDVGWRKEWILQYSEAPSKSPEPRGNGMVISLGREPRLEAPYVQFIRIPGESDLDRDRYLVVSARLGRDGRLASLKPAGVATKDYATLIPLLAAWRFRPATKSGEAVELEAVLVIPPKTGNP